ncbi:MAG: HAMP domain-containing sensor histidine kinase, partial [Bacteroidota bacterium]
KAALLDNMTHEFRTPIAGIQGIAHILMEELEGEHRELVGLIHESGQRLLDTLMTVLVMAKLEAGSVEHRPRTVAIGPLMEELVQPFRKKAATLGLSLRMATEPLEARLDPNCLDLLLRPLLNNAIKFTEEGHVSVSLRRRGPMLVLEVADTGIGIGATFLPRLFEPFEQESEGLRRTHEGTGLGLAIVHRTARLMGATVSVSSTPGVGTTFTVDLPGSVALDPDALTPVSQTRALS